MKITSSGPARPWTKYRARPFWTPANVAILIAAIAIGVTLSGQASAQAQPSVGIFDDILNQYMSKAIGWESKLRGIALSLFGMLSVISLAWSLIRYIMNKADLGGFIPMMVMQIMTLGFFLFLVEKGSWIAGMLIESFITAGERVSGQGDLSPSWIVINGFDSVFRVFEKIGELNWGDMAATGLPLAFCGIVILVCFVIVAIILLVTMIEAYIVMYGGVILLGFGALPWTRDIPKNYLIYAINVGVKLFVLYLVVGMGVEFSTDWPNMIASANNESILKTVLLLMSGALVYAAVAWKIPGIAAAVSSGSLNFNASDAIGVGAAAGAAAGVAAGVATGGVGALASATVGAIQAQTAGTALAAEKGASGLGAAVKGLGHAVGAVGKEAGAALKASTGVAPPSPNAQDGRGRPIENMGTRAANRLGGDLQASREQAAGAPAGSAGGTAGTGSAQGDAQPGGNASQQGGAGGSRPVVDGAPRQTATVAGPSGEGPEFRQPDPSNPNWGSNIAPPQLPPDAATGGVQINFNHGDD